MWGPERRAKEATSNTTGISGNISQQNVPQKEAIGRVVFSAKKWNFKG
jgi:hypothetical protein